MNNPATELARPEMVTGLRITTDGSVQKVEIPKCDPRWPVHRDRLHCCQRGPADRSAGHVDRRPRLYNSQPNPLATKLAHHFQPDIPLPYRQPYFGTAVLLGVDQDTGDMGDLVALLRDQHARKIDTVAPVSALRAQDG